MRRWLTALSIVFTATVVVFVLVNLIAAPFAPERRSLVWEHPVFNEATRAIYERIYGLPIATVREIVNEAWAEHPWIFEPYVQFRERPRTGQWVNISTEGYRLNRRDDRARFTPVRGAVFLLGGSTTFGYGVRDQDTIAAHLEQMLRQEHPTYPGAIGVYNFGRGYYGLSQEVLLLKSLVQRGMVPAVAVFIDGVNEQFCPTYSDNIAEAFRIIQDDPRAQLRAAVMGLPIVRLFARRHVSELAANALFRNRSVAGSGFECGCPEESRCRAQFLAMMRANRQMVRALAREFGFEAHFVLQPVGGYRNRFTVSPEGMPARDWAPIWRELERYTEGEHEHSLTASLEDFQGEAFVDFLHYSAGANRRIAERLSPIVAGALRALPGRSGR